MVARSWSADYADPDFWDPKLHAPICYNALAARSQVPATIKERNPRVFVDEQGREHLLKPSDGGYASGHFSASCSIAWLNSTIVGFSRSNTSSRSRRLTLSIGPYDLFPDRES
jgi:hypothetical protein